jgi:hypothetical protein
VVEHGLTWFNRLTTNKNWELAIKIDKNGGLPPKTQGFISLNHPG